MLGAIDQFETEIRAERHMDGIKKAKEHGVAFGRKKKLNKNDVAVLQQRQAEGVLIKILMRVTISQKRVSIATSGRRIPKIKVAANLQNILFGALCQNTFLKTKTEAHQAVPLF